jgi:Na+-driven multidrug efflux pump
MVSVIVAIILCLNVDPILMGMGATPALLPGGRAYVFIFAISFPFIVVGSTAYYFTRLAEKPLAAALVYVIPAFGAIALEYYLIFHLGMGPGASSAAGGLCAGFTFILLPYLQFGKTIFKIKKSDFRIDFKIVWESCKIGFVMFIIPVSIMAAVIVTNNLITANGGTETHLAAFGIAAGYIVYILSIITTAFITGIAPIASYNYGARQYKRVMSVIKIGVVQSSLVIAVVVILIYICIKPIIAFFTGPDPTLLHTTIEALQIYMFLAALGNVSQITSGYFLAVERSGLAILNGISRMTIFAIPLLMILPKFFGLKGIWMSQPGADALSFILALGCLYLEYKRLKKLDLAEETM